MSRRSFIIDRSNEKRDFERYIKSMNAWERERERVREIEGEMLDYKNRNEWKFKRMKVER